MQVLGASHSGQRNRGNAFTPFPVMRMRPYMVRQDARDVEHTLVFGCVQYIEAVWLLICR